MEEEIGKLPPTPDECPITTLIGTRVTQMSDAELEEYTRNMRAVVDSPQELRKRVSFSKTGTAKKVAQPKVDIAKLLGL